MKNNKYLLFEMMEKLNPDFKQNKLRFIIPVGISSSGKSRWIKSLEGQGFVVISPDDIRRELTGNISDQSRNKEVFPLAFQRAVDTLNANKNVIFDATNVVSNLRKQMLDYMKQNVNNDFEAQAKIFDVDPEISKERIRRDIENSVDRSNVPDEAIDRQYKNFKNDLNKIESDGYTIIDQ
jgi:predicted kinase